jgi:hypothetical protein
MMPSWLIPARGRATEATPAQVAASGAGGGGATDPVDGDSGFVRAGGGRREVPSWTREQARTASVAAYRVNPMARAIVDTYTSFAVGDSGLSLQVTNPDVRRVVDEFWNDPRNNLHTMQTPMLRDLMLMGEQCHEMLVGQQSGVVRFAPRDTTGITDVEMWRGNPLWPSAVVFGSAGDDVKLSVVQVDDQTSLRDGQAQWWTPWKTLLTDKRSMPFLAPVLDWLDSYDTVMSNLIDRTALARYLVWDVEVKGTQAEVDAFVEARGGTQIPMSGSVEVHNENVTWTPKGASTGAFEDSKAAASVLTLIAGGSGLSKVWLAEPEDANRATSLTMAEPVRRRVGGVQQMWLGYQTELVRYAVDRAVAAKRLPETVQGTDPKTGATFDIPASQAVTITGPEIAAADAQIAAQTMLNLSTGLEKLVEVGALTREAAGVAARRAWEDYVGVPYSSDLGKPDANPDDLATAIDESARSKHLRPA